MIVHAIPAPGRRGHRADRRVPRPPRRRSDAAQGAAGHRSGRRPGPRQDARLRRVRGPRARHPRRREDRRLPGRGLQEAGPEAGQPRRHLRPEGAARRHHAGGRAADDHRRRRRPVRHGTRDAGVARRRRGVDEARDRGGQGRCVGAGVRRLRRPGAGVRLGRLQGRRRGRQDAGDAGQRSAGARPGVAVGARREDVRRPGHDLLRPLDLQVRDRREAQGRRRADRPRDRPRRLSVRGRAGQDRRAVHLRHARQEHGPRGHRRLDHAGHRPRRSSRAPGRTSTGSRRRPRRGPSGRCRSA